ncbi:tetratricopeptide repeat protein [Weeksellaceae bacterium KMM 9724]|uniref:tetratricopeptide repeat-containing sensor histidine kinase n=1 Tax=Profundicola chukchiensis TaxID=2961959 RepID=UPI00243DB4CF|nr:tetratricopeptide repeat protein [Profundicola chukchiensis]MDG4949835.1 tetratricopeptide repeat protein [Profundicola chukchiensis]
MRNLYFQLFFLLFAVLLNGQNIDSLKSIATKQTGDEAARTYLNLSDAYIQTLDGTSIQENAKLALKYAKEDLLRGKAYYNLGISNVLLNQGFLQIKNFNLASSILNGLKDSLAANAMYYAHRGYRMNAMYPEALAKGLEELKFRQTNLPKNKLLTQVHQEIGYTYDRMNDFEKAIVWFKKSLEVADEMGDEKSKGRSYGLIGIAYDGLEVYDSALIYNKKAIDIFKKYNDQASQVTWYSNLGNTYSKIGDLDNAEKFTRLSLDAGDQNNPKPLTLINLGKILMDKGDFSSAKNYLDSAYNLALNLGELRSLSEVYYQYHEFYLQQGDYEKALIYYTKYKENEDEIYSEAKLKDFDEMSITYETAEKEREILGQRASLAEKELKIQRRGYTVWGLILLTFIIAFIGYLFYNQQKMKAWQLEREKVLRESLNQKETENKLQQQRLNISRDLHDNIGAQLTFIISSLDNLKYGFSIENDKVHDRLDQISEFTRETIYGLRDTIWAMNQSEISFEDLRARITNFIEKANLFRKNTNFIFEIDPQLQLDRKFNSVEGMNIYRIIQEAVNNATKYSQASLIKILISKNSDGINFSIEDNGVGFDPIEFGDGNGINSMRKRAADLHTELEIISEKDAGTKISFNYK